MKLSEIIIRRQIRRILQEEVPTSTAAQGTYGYAAVRPTGGSGKLTTAQKITLAVLGAIGARALWGIINYDEKKGKPAGYDGKMGMNAVVCGDSQGAGPLGVEIGKILEKKGYKVRNVAVAGANPDQVLSQVKGNAEGAILVVSIFGGNTTDVDAPARATTEMYKFCEEKGTAFIAIGSPPVTKIKSYTEFAASFPARSVEAAGNVDYWLNLPPSNSYSPEGRKKLSDKMEAAKGPGGEDIIVYGIASHWTAGPGGNYPEQPDGLHCINGAPEVAREAMSAVNIDGVTSELQAQLKKATNKDLDTLGMDGKPGAVTSPDQLDLEKFKKGIAASEGNYKSFNKAKDSQALGKYQFIPSYHWPKIRAFALDKGVDFGDPRPGKQGSITGRGDWDMFLNRPDIQEGFMDEFIKTNLFYENKGIENYNKSRGTDQNIAKLDLAQILAVTHFAGARGPRDINQYGINTVPKKADGTDTENNATYARYLSNFTSVYY